MNLSKGSYQVWIRLCVVQRTWSRGNLNDVLVDVRVEDPVETMEPGREDEASTEVFLYLQTSRQVH